MKIMNGMIDIQIIYKIIQNKYTINIQIVIYKMVIIIIIIIIITSEMISCNIQNLMKLTSSDQRTFRKTQRLKEMGDISRSAFYVSMERPCNNPAIIRACINEMLPKILKVCFAWQPFSHASS